MTLLLWTIGFLCVSTGLAFLGGSLQKLRDRRLPARILAALGASSPLTLPALVEAVDARGYTARGRVSLALRALVQQGKVAEARPDRVEVPMELTERTTYRLTQN